MGAYCINTSGRTVPVYSDNTLTQQIGSIYPYECFAFTSRWEGSHAFYPDAVDQVYFRTSSGTCSYGWILNTGAGEETSFLDYSFGTIRVENTSFKILKSRSARSCYDASGTWTATCPAGARILTNDTTPGQSHPYRMAAMFYETGVNTGVFRSVSGNGISHGFIESGLASGSLSTAIGIYGNW